MISRVTLDELPLDVPSVDTQKKIVELVRLHKYKKELEKKRIALLELKMNALLTGLSKGGK